MIVGRCEECGFDPASVSPADAAASVRAFARRYQAPLSRFLPGEDGPAILRATPAAGGWSALEYAAHVRDVFDFFRQRVERLSEQDGAQFETADHEQAVADGGYNNLDPAEVATEVAAAANALADRLDALTEVEWARVGRGSAGEARPMLVLARRAVHEGSHHLLDIGRRLREARQR